jgi:hypothetical protein
MIYSFLEHLPKIAEQSVKYLSPAFYQQFFLSHYFSENHMTEKQ